MWWSTEDRIQKAREECARIDQKSIELEKQLSALSARLDSQNSQMQQLSHDIKTAPSAVVLERVESLERRFSSLHEMLVTKSPATGEPQLSKAGRAFKKFFRAS